MRSCKVISLSLKVSLYACVRIYNNDNQEHLFLELLGKVIIFCCLFSVYHTNYTHAPSSENQQRLWTLKETEHACHLPANDETPCPATLSLPQAWSAISWCNCESDRLTPVRFIIIFFRLYTSISCFLRQFNTDGNKLRWYRSVHITYGNYE